MFYGGVKLLLSCVLLYLLTVMLICCVFLTPIWYSFLGNLLKEGRLLYFLVVFIPLVTSFVVIAPAAVHFGYKSIVNYFLEAWKDLTLDIEPGGVPIEAAFESV
jgi:ABC-type sugar transport system permease subunit